MSEQSEPIRVDPGTLPSGGTKISVAADSARDAFATHHRRMEDAMTGWSPTSRSAMEQQLEKWGATHAQITAAVRAHGDALQSAARDYAAQDAANADAVNATATNLD